MEPVRSVGVEQFEALHVSNVWWYPDKGTSANVETLHRSQFRDCGGESDNVFLPRVLRQVGSWRELLSRIGSRSLNEIQ
jgi:hypothetical protein